MAYETSIFATYTLNVIQKQSQTLSSVLPVSSLHRLSNFCEVVAYAVLETISTFSTSEICFDGSP